MRFSLSNSSLKCASSDIQVFVAGWRDERALNTKKAHFGKGEKWCFFTVSGICLCKIASYEKIRSDSWSIQFNMLDDTKLSEFGWGEYSALLSLRTAVTNFYMGKLYGAHFMADSRAKTCNCKNLTTIVRVALCREM